MNVTQNVIHDLLPAYLAGEASADTVALVEEFLRLDPDLAQNLALKCLVFSKNLGNNILDNSVGLRHNGFMAADPKTLQEAVLYFADADNCREYIVARRWPNGVECPQCGSKSVKFQPKH